MQFELAGHEIPSIFTNSHISPFIKLERHTKNCYNPIQDLLKESDF
jgi:hypothetical protein